MSKKRQGEAKAKAQKQMERGSGGGGNNNGRNNAGGGGGGGNGNGAGANRGGKALSASSGNKTKLDSNGRLIAGSSFTTGVGHGASLRDSNRFSPTKQSSEKINNYLKKTGYSLRGGDGRKVVGFKAVNTPSYSNPVANPNSGGFHIPGGRETLAIYGPSKKERRANRDGGGGKRGGGRSSGEGGRTGGGSTSGPGSAVERTRQYAEDRIYGRVPEGRKPEMFPQGVQVEGRAPEAVANYTDRLDTYNQNLHGWMNDRAVASQYESGQFLQNFAAGLPKAPDIMSTDEMFRTARRFSEIEYA